eukprot:3488022-Prymnesium_polylepis.1
MPFTRLVLARGGEQGQNVYVRDKVVAGSMRHPPPILPDTREGTVPHQDSPARIPWSVCEYNNK